MGFYDGIDGEQAANDLGAWGRAGHYLVLLSRIRSGVSVKNSCDFVAADMTVLHAHDDSDKPMMVNPATEAPKDWVADPKGMHYIGEEISVQFLAKYQSAKRNYKAFIGNAVGVPEAQVTPQFCAQVESENLLGGEVLELNNRMIAKKDGGPFTKVWCVRAVPASEFAKVLDPKVAERYFPEGFEALIAAES